MPGSPVWAVAAHRLGPRLAGSVCGAPDTQAYSFQTRFRIAGPRGAGAGCSAAEVRRYPSWFAG
ncbi:MAG: hypothetical protein MUQ32_15650, partial [Chloroflexi bacterium]|nr:hypothetical protein [Chloroflexota bacterium]